MKNMPGDIIFLHMFTKNHNHTMWGSWDTAYDVWKDQVGTVKFKRGFKNWKMGTFRSGKRQKYDYYFIKFWRKGGHFCLRGWFAPNHSSMLHGWGCRLKEWHKRWVSSLDIQSDVFGLELMLNALKMLVDAKSPIFDW